MLLEKDNGISGGWNRLMMTYSVQASNLDHADVFFTQWNLLNEPELVAKWVSK